jgi:hypothetical protein
MKIILKVKSCFNGAGCTGCTGWTGWAGPDGPGWALGGLGCGIVAAQGPEGPTPHSAMLEHILDILNLAEKGNDISRP